MTCDKVVHRDVHRIKEGWLCEIAYGQLCYHRKTMKGQEKIWEDCHTASYALLVLTLEY